MAISPFLTHTMSQGLHHRLSAGFDIELEHDFTHPVFHNRFVEAQAGAIWQLILSVTGPASIWRCNGLGSRTAQG